MAAIVAIVRDEDRKLLEIKSPEESDEVLIDRAKNQRAHCYLTEALKTKIRREVEFNYRWMFD